MVFAMLENTKDDFLRHYAIAALVKSPFLDKKRLARKIGSLLIVSRTGDGFSDFYIKTLKDLDHPTAIESLISALAFKKYRVRANNALMSITGESFGPQAKKWRDWHKKSKR